MKKIIPMPSWNFPLSSAIVHDSKYEMEISGYTWKDPSNGKLEEWIEKQTARAMDNIKSVLEKVNWDTSNIVKVRIFLLNMDDYNAMNEVYATYFEGDYPARFALWVAALPGGALVEIECKAVGDEINM